MSAVGARTGAMACGGCATEAELLIGEGVRYVSDGRPFSLAGMQDKVSVQRVEVPTLTHDVAGCGWSVQVLGQRPDGTLVVAVVPTL